ncbi:MCE family protein [Amycolatopsis suaedae]|uniref:MCE family protein n=1 Tax=Amycolatopsis suaedae TaxID=2510978 RepID=A0A4Q7JER9_9PSEU|nr:MlaD family protein [Amycolatopsis suaedae]RZQ65818.1 MCE family protein [Amycolatopsis suaedae]
MLTRFVRIQVIVFLVLALAGVAYVGARYARLDALFGGAGYQVRLQLPDSGGVFTNAEVTYRGVGIGRVGELRLVDGGVEVDLHIDDDAPAVPADLDVAVANRSAVGEQYLDLRPRRAGEPFLAGGAVIRPAAPVLPPPVDSVLLNLDRLVESVPKDELRTVVDELYDATEGAGPHLQTLLDTTASVTRAATEHLPQTLSLIADAGPVLRTQADMAGALSSFGTNAKLVAEQLTRSDGDIRALISSAPATARQVSALLAESGPGLGTVLANLLTTSNVLLTRQEGVERLLVVTPAAVDAAGRILRPEGTSAGLQTTFFTPPPCTRGYEGTPYRNGLDVSPAPLNTAARCTG